MILAKSEKRITLSQHTKGLLEQLEVLRAKTTYLEDNLFYNLLKIVAFCHDLGKVSPSFQISVRNWQYNPNIPFPDIPHSIFSIFWINQKELQRRIYNEDEQKLLFTAVAFHHWRENFEELVNFSSRELKKALQILLEDHELRDSLLQNLKNEFNDESFLDYHSLIGFNKELAEEIVEGKKFSEILFLPYLITSLPSKIEISDDTFKKLRILLGSLLRLDHFVSFIQKEEMLDLKIEIEPEIKDKVIQLIDKNIKSKGGKCWQLEEIRKNDLWNKSLILVAPTGSGKTEFAFLWSAGEKTIFTLPLRTAVNSLYERARDIFSFNKTGLLHSDADIYIYEKIEKREIDRLSWTGEETELMRVLELARHLSYPFLVSTGDQIFPSALQYPGYEKIFLPAGTSRLVIDEVQAYDPKACAIIIKMIEEVTKMGGRFLLMTATLPEFVKRNIENRCGTFQLINKYEGLENFKKHRIVLRDIDIESDEVINEITGHAQKGKRVLVILNTVKKAQNIYDKLRSLCNDKFYLKILHSQFSLSERQIREKEIIDDKFKNPKPDNEKNGKILVATQVVEASLDIDADLLFTEIAPLDYLVQRMGRVLRRVSYVKVKEFRYNDDPNVYICFTKRNSLEIESGEGRVYSKDLLFISLMLIAKMVKALKSDEVEKIKRKLQEISNSKNSLRKKREQMDKQFNTILRNLKIKEGKGKRTYKSFLISEKDKEILVRECYEILDMIANCSYYMDEFYTTLNILDAGYVSNRKKDAQRLFREIYTIPIIAGNQKEKFKKDIKKFVNTHTKINYTQFKKNVLNKYVLHSYIEDFLIPVYHWLVEIPDLSSENYKRLRNWLSDIYVGTGNYDNEKGYLK